MSQNRLISSLLAQVSELKKENSRLKAARGFFAGSYATAPCLFALEHPNEASWDLQKETAFYDGLAGTPGLRGLEVQFFPTAKMHPFDEEWASPMRNGHRR